MKDYSLKMKSELYLFEVKAKHIVITVRKIIIRYFACLLDIVQSVNFSAHGVVRVYCKVFFSDVFCIARRIFVPFKK